MDITRSELLIEVVLRGVWNNDSTAVRWTLQKLEMAISPTRIGKCELMDPRQKKIGMVGIIYASRPSGRPDSCNMWMAIDESIDPCANYLKFYRNGFIPVSFAVQAFWPAISCACVAIILIHSASSNIPGLGVLPSFACPS